MPPSLTNTILDSALDHNMSAQLYIDIKSADAVIPIMADLSESCGHLLARLLRALGLDTVVSDQRVAFFLVHNDIPLEVEDILFDTGVVDRDHLKLGMYTYLIE